MWNFLKVSAFVIVVVQLLAVWTLGIVSYADDSACRHAWNVRTSSIQAEKGLRQEIEKASKETRRQTQKDLADALQKRAAQLKKLPGVYSTPEFKKSIEVEVGALNQIVFSLQEAEEIK